MGNDWLVAVEIVLLICIAAGLFLASFSAGKRRAAELALREYTGELCGVTGNLYNAFNTAQIDFGQSMSTAMMYFNGLYGKLLRGSLPYRDASCVAARAALLELHGKFAAVYGAGFTSAAELSGAERRFFAALLDALTELQSALVDDNGALLRQATYRKYLAEACGRFAAAARSLSAPPAVKTGDRR